MKHSVYSMLLILCIMFAASCAGGDKSTGSVSNTNDIVRVMFYNVENLFDTLDDPHINDNEFLPESSKHWTKYRYWNKLEHIAKVIMNLGQWHTPALIGLAEIENKSVLDDLVHQYALRNFDYRIIHRESPDHRGIDVALLYRKDIFKPVDIKFIPIHFPFDEEMKTRDILYASGKLGTDTIHVFVNHWPSRYGGSIASRPKRDYVASVLRKQIDSLDRIYKTPNILIMGDFNDDPEDHSISAVLQAAHDTLGLSNQSLFNPMYNMHSKGEGTLKYHGYWNLFDQIIVSGIMLKKSNSLSTKPAMVHIFNAPWLMEADTKYPGKFPLRTYAGSQYLGGFSDHLPVYIDINVN